MINCAFVFIFIGAQRGASSELNGLFPLEMAFIILRAMS